MICRSQSSAGGKPPEGGVSTPTEVPDRVRDRPVLSSRDSLSHLSWLVTGFRFARSIASAP